MNAAEGSGVITSLARAAGRGLALAAVAALACASACAPKETPEQRVSRLRMQYEVQPTGFQPRTTDDGTPELALDILVLNKGRESLGHLTFVLRILKEDGSERLNRPVSIDTSELLPGVTSQLSAIVTGVELQEGEQVVLELEPNPSASERASYPEYRDALSSPA